MHRRALPTLLVTGLIVLAAAGAAWHAEIQREALIALLAVLAPAPLVVRGLQRRFDPFEPIAIIAVGLTLLFVVRPLAHVLSGEMTARGLNIEAGFDTALLVALVGIASLYVGYSIRGARSVARWVREVPGDWRPDLAVVAAATLVAIGLALLIVFVVQIGGTGTAGSVLFTRTAATSAQLEGSSAYLYLAPFMAIPATLVFIEAAARSRRVTLFALAGLSGLLVVVLTGPRGSRIWLLALVASVAVLPYLRRQRRPRVIAIVAAMVCVFLVGITFLREVRVPEEFRAGTPSDVLVHSVQNPLDSANEFILGPDTEMFSILALEVEVVPSEHPHLPGVTALSLLSRPVPNQLWPGKPETADARIFTYLFPRVASATRAGSAPSVFGGLWLDSGYFGVVIGSFLFGFAARVLYEYFLRLAGNPSVRLLYAASLPVVLMLLRGNPTDTLARAAFLIVPILIIVWFAAPRRPWARLPSRAPVAEWPLDRRAAA